MKNKELKKFHIDYINLNGEKHLATKIRISFDTLINDLLILPENSTQSVILSYFKNCIYNINRFENEIETIEREFILENIYAVGEIIGLDPTSEYAEAWRGDW